ncbi:phage holin family protein [Planomonospora algeriensis]
MANSTKEGLSTGELIKRISEEVSRLVRDEIKLARIELAEKGRYAGRGAGMLGGAGVIALFGGGALVAAVILLLAQVMPAWAAAAVVGAVLLLAAAVLGRRGKRQVSGAARPPRSGPSAASRTTSTP